MLPLSETPPLLARGERKSEDAGRESVPIESGLRERGRVLACAACRRWVTADTARIAVSGRHAHTFANPHGYVYTIGCFSTASGLVLVGPPSREFAWFASHEWQIEQCGGCLAHMGWLFRGEGRVFHGLILDRLIELRDETS